MLKVVLTLKPSRLFIALLVALHMIAAVAVVIAHLPWWMKGIGVVGVILSGYYHIWLKEFQTASWAMVKCERNEDNWTLHLKDGKEVAAQLKRDAFVSPWFLILHFKASEKSWWRYRSLVVFKDSMDADTFRRTKVFLLQGRNE